jgi:hypothetical protein
MRLVEIISGGSASGSSSAGPQGRLNLHAQVEDEKSGYVIIKNWHENYAKAWDEQECWHTVARTWCLLGKA